jgi:hypothetical protein
MAKRKSVSPARAEKALQARPLTYHAILAYFLANPCSTPPTAARDLGVSESWLRAVTNTDLFQMRLTQARGEVDHAVVVNTTERMTATLDKALDALDGVLDTEDGRTNADLLLAVIKELGERWSEIKGFRASKVGVPAPVQINQQFVADPHLMEELRAAALKQGGPIPPALEHEPESATETEGTP